MFKKNYNIKKTISVKQFITEFGTNFPEHVKERLLDLEVRCVLTRKEDINRLDIKHVEHTKHSSHTSSTGAMKEYIFGQLLVIEDNLYYSEKCLKNDDSIDSPIVKKIYSELDEKDMVTDEATNAKKIDDSNIDYIIDSIISVCPEVSKEYQDIVKGMLSRVRK